MTEQSCDLIGTWKFPVQVQGFCPSLPDPFLLGGGIWGQGLLFICTCNWNTHATWDITIPQYRSIKLAVQMSNYKLSLTLILCGHLPDVFLEVETTVRMATIPATQVYDSAVRVN